MENSKKNQATCQHTRNAHPHVMPNNYSANESKFMATDVPGQSIKYVKFRRKCAPINSSITLKFRMAFNNFRMCKLINSHKFYFYIFIIWMEFV